jgi:cytoskeletal protein CcmA (bactofilin family)
MALKDFRSRAPKVEPEEKPVVGTTARPTTFIDKGCELSGKMCFSEPVQIDGRIDGEIEAEKAVIVGVSGSVQASIACESIVIFGEVQGDVDAKRVITIHKNARVNAQMRTAGIVVEEGAKFKGQILIGSEEENPTPAKPAPLTQPGGSPASNQTPSGPK